MKYGILFDLDGTLLDTLEDLADSVNYALGVYGYPTRTLAEIRSFVGNGAAKLIALSVPQGADPAPVLVTFQKYYKDHCQVKTGPYPGILQALEDVAGKWPVAIVSNKPDPAVKALCADCFPGVYALGERADCPRKPAPDMLYKAMEELGVEGCVYVGDSEVDVVTAANAGAACVSVTWGFRDEAVLLEAGAKHLCRSVQELPGMIKEILF